MILKLCSFFSSGDLRATVFGAGADLQHRPLGGGGRRRVQAVSVQRPRRRLRPSDRGGLLVQEQHGLGPQALPPREQDYVL